MTSKSEPLAGKIVSNGKKGSGLAKGIAGMDALNALNTMVDGTLDYLRLREEERTKRAKLDTYERTELRKIETAEAVLKDYFRQAFAERKQNTDELFARYDAAIERGDADSAHLALQGVIDIAKSSPLNDLGDLGQIRAALDNEKHVWEL
ncbi:hypothetical protein DXX98_11465 [Janibacter melonis]|nr:hypothetical protein [Janibacter melonis]